VTTLINVADGVADGLGVGDAVGVAVGVGRLVGVGLPVGPPVGRPVGCGVAVGGQFDVLVPVVDVPAEELEAAALAALYWAWAVTNCCSAVVLSTVARTWPDFTLCPTFTNTEVTGKVEVLNDRSNVVFGWTVPLALIESVNVVTLAGVVVYLTVEAVELAPPLTASPIATTQAVAIAPT
jgi:hypothetical protein